MNGLTVYSNIENNTLELLVKGRVTAENATQLMEEVRKDFAAFTDVVIDAKEMEYIASAGLRQLMQIVSVTDGKNGKTTVKNANDAVKEVLEDTGFTDILQVVE